MQPSAIEIRVRDADELRAVWLEGFEHGGLFVPGTFSIAAGVPVRVRVTTEYPSATTVLEGTVMWRRLPQRETAPSALRAGIGIAFSPVMRPRVLFLERLARGAAADGRAAVRYPTDLRGELVLRTGERPSTATLVDVAVRGAKIVLPDPAAIVPPESVVELRVASPRSGESIRSGLVGRVAWSTRDGKTALGVRLDLATTEERLHWAKVVTRAREVFEEHPIKVQKLVG